MSIRSIMEIHELELDEVEQLDSNSLSDDDADICDSDEVSRLFASCPLISEKPVALSRKYVLHIVGTLENNPNVAVGLSDHTSEVYNLSNNQFTKLAVLSEHTDVMTEVKFSSENSNLIYTGSYDGSVKLWDIRTPTKSTLQFIDTTTEHDSDVKQFSCFDISTNNRLIAAGTNFTEGDAFILFWDVRKASLMGGYWESHTDDITQVKFHSSDPNKLISGSTDGLVNLYNLTEGKEEDALVDTFNTSSSVEKLKWLQQGSQDVISCITHTADVQFWKLENAQPYLHLDRQKIGEKMKKKSGDYIYVVDVHNQFKNIFLLGGSNYQGGNSFRGLCIANNTVTPSLEFSQNKQIIRSTWFNSYLNLLLSGGEKGIINAWEVPHIMP